jgi:hypothetical protein
MKSTLNKIGISLAICILVFVSGTGIANAQQVLVSSLPFPSGAPFDTNVIVGCDNATAPPIAGYQFLFWDNQGTISWNTTVSICSGSGDTVANAWYLDISGGGPCPPTGCYVQTYAFSTDHNLVIGPGAGAGTPIALVAPNSPVAWTTPSTTVLTNHAAENISAESALAFPPYAAEPFRFWQVLNTTTETPIGIVYNATVNDTAWVVAFYGPDPCQTLRAEFQSCEQGLGEGGKLNCGPIGKALQACEVQNREIQ